MSMGDKSLKVELLCQKVCALVILINITSLGLYRNMVFSEQPSTQMGFDLAHLLSVFLYQALDTR